MELSNTLIIAAIGAIAGILGGLFGLGGAIIIIPAMVMLLGYSQQMAQGTTLMMMVLPVGGLAAFQYYQKGYVDIKVSIIMALFFFVGGYFGAKLATQFPQEILKKGFAIMLILIAIKILFFEKQ
jgi:uncharacterized membrane protein YfcA